ncbi:hypothetical protein PMAYCL1PPCAC_29690 [Pristionchus mayeri]|uniref:Ankyrin repeat-containing protein n=1 Tax=Pristionchus mayeri TaxID=1317129 RepID=A0AAN5DBC9_9BILA|nr:hypothetical protein PMAYCL1PPCAC_29690 [Pristionchus mayeri]
MANGGKKKNKKNDETGRKESARERMNQEIETKRQIVTANVDNGISERDQPEAPIDNEGSITTKDCWSNKDGEKNEKKVVGDKRRDSMGGSVSTSSNSSGTDEEVLSPANRSLIPSPQSDISEESQASAPIHIAHSISSIDQVAQSVVEAGTEEALTTLSEYLPYTMTRRNSKNKKKVEAGNLAVGNTTEIGEVSASLQSPSPVPRQVVTPILNGNISPPSTEVASFRSISDDHPGEMSDATPKIEKEKEKEVHHAIPRQHDPSLSLTLRQHDQIRPYKGAAGHFPIPHANFPVEHSDALFHDLVRQQYVHSIIDPLCSESLLRRSEYLEKTTKENVRDRLEAYISNTEGKEQDWDFMEYHELAVQSETTEGHGLWVKGEREVLKNILDDVPKLLAKQKVPWIRDLLKLIFDGKAKKVHNRLRVMVSMLRHRGGFDKCTDAEIYTHVATTLLEAGTNTRLGYSYVHVLAAQGRDEMMCAEEGHKRCMTLQMMLAPLTPESLQKALSLKAVEWRMRTPLHFATATGQPCQLDALQHFKADCTAPDQLGATPIVYAVLRDNVPMLRMLAWYGADTMQTCDKYGHTALDWVNVTGKFPLGKNCVDFIEKRNSAFEDVIKRWMHEITSVFILKKGLSEVHTLDCRQPSDQVMEKIPINNEVVNIPHWIGHINKTVHFKLRPTVNNDDRSCMFLLIIPFTYRITDDKSPPECPDIVRRTLFTEEDDGRPRPIQFLTEHPFIKVKDPLSSRPPLQKALVPLLVQPNTGTFWAYKIPSDVLSNECIWVNLSLDLLKVDVILRDNLRLLIQVVSLHSKQQYSSI